MMFALHARRQAEAAAGVLTDVVKYNLFLQNEYLIAENLWFP